MNSIKAQVCVEFLKDVVYTTKSGELVSFDGEYFYYGTGKKADIDHLVFLPLTNYVALDKFGDLSKEKEVWQFEHGQNPKLLSDGYVVETENFKRVGDWIYIKETGGAIPLKIINNRVITYDFPVCPGRNGKIITESGKKIILRSEVGGLCMSEEGIYGAVDIEIDHGTVEELLQVLA